MNNQDKIREALGTLLSAETKLAELRAEVKAIESKIVMYEHEAARVLYNTKRSQKVLFRGNVFWVDYSPIDGQTLSAELLAQQRELRRERMEVEILDAKSA